MVTTDKLILLGCFLLLPAESSGTGSEPGTATRDIRRVG